MYHKILDYMKSRPNEYAKSTHKFWDDEHISKFMLEAHLNPNVEAASRQLTFILDSIEWITAINSPVNTKKLLDLGCGPGIYAELFYEKGFDVTGIDFSKRSIHYAMEHAEKMKKSIHYYYQNYFDIEYTNQFDVITLIYCDYGVLNPVDRLSLLRKIRNALKKDGMLILDGFTVHQYSEFIEKKEITYEKSGFWSSSPYVCIKNDYAYHKTNNYLTQYIIISENDCKCYNIWDQAFTEETIRKELINAGFTDIELFDDVCGKPYSFHNTTICVIARQ